MNFLRQSTASQTRSIGVFVDETDGTTPETALTIANTDVKLMANGGASANKTSGGGTHRINGHYSFTFDATDTATVGELTVSIDVAGALPVYKTFFVLEEAVYDALFAATADGVNATALRSSVGLGSANLDTQLSTIDTNVDAILVDTNELQTDLTDGGRVDLILDGIAEDTGTTIPGLFPTNFSLLGINGSGHVSRVVLVDTTTTNTDMRGTDSALLASGVPTNFASLGINASGHVLRVVLTDTTTTNTDMRGTDSANTTTPPTTAAIATAVLTTQMTESYAADGTAPTLAQAQFMCWSILAERSISGTTLTAKQLDGSTNAMTFTLDDATTPTSQTRAT